jgi:glycosyltransferase involved in cell wall biosynthesis
MKISVVIPAYNEEKYLLATLEKIRTGLAETDCAWEIIVVDNESEDETAQIAKDFGAKVVSEAEHNIGKVRNTGAKKSAGDVLIFVDADTLVPAEIFQKVSEKMKNLKCFGGSAAVDYERFKRKWMKYYLLGWRFWGTLFNMKQGAMQFCRKSVFDKIDGYDETVFMGEDVLFYWKLAVFARRYDGFLHFIKNPKVLTSARRFDKMSLWKTFLLTHPTFIVLAARKKKFWKDWYETPIR